MKKYLFLFLLVYGSALQAQNVGIGTAQPSKKLSVNGSIVLDHGSINHGTLDSAALLFGNEQLTGISSNKQGAVNPAGLDVWTNGVKRLSVAQNGNIGINTTPDPIYKFKLSGISRFLSNAYFDGSVNVEGLLTVPGNSIFSGDVETYKLQVHDHLRVGDHAAIGGLRDTNYTLRVYGPRPSRFGGSLETWGNMTVGGALDPAFKLRVIGGNSRFGGDAQVTGRMAVGGDMDDNFRLRVYDGNSRFGGNVEVTGQINTASMSVDALSIGGKGSVKSDGLSPLRVGFASKYVDVVIPAGSTVEYTANITDFDGDNDDIRVAVSQFAPAAGGSALAFERSIISVTNVNASEDTCKIKLYNAAGGQLYLKGTIYLLCVAKN